MKDLSSLCEACRRPLAVHGMRLTRGLPVGIDFDKPALCTDGERRPWADILGTDELVTDGRVFVPDQMGHDAPNGE